MRFKRGGSGETSDNRLQEERPKPHNYHVSVFDVRHVNKDILTSSHTACLREGG